VVPREAKTGFDSQHPDMKKLKIPYYRQETDYFCGPAALKMALEFFGKKVSQKKLAGLLKTNEKRGTLRRDMIKTARGFGLSARGFFGKNLDEVKKFLNTGNIAIVIFVEPSSEEDHYSVLAGVGRGCVVLNDPLSGKNFEIKEKDFIARWNKWNRWFMVIGRRAL